LINEYNVLLIVYTIKKGVYVVNVVVANVFFNIALGNTYYVLIEIRKKKKMYIFIKA
jgi:hypothetical protein